MSNRGWILLGYFAAAMWLWGLIAIVLGWRP
jgi:hypothetical protein